MSGQTGQGERTLLRVLGLPVLILTGHAEAMQIPDDLPVLTKPFRSADLAARVATLLDGGAEPAT